MKTVRLENWSVVTRGDGYQAPETLKQYLSGEVHDHPSFSNGDKVTTSSIQEIDGNKIYTRNTCYVLGQVSSSYVDWMKQNNISFDPKNPIKTKTTN